MQDLLHVDAGQHLEAIREVNVRKGWVDGIGCIPKKCMVEADHLHFTFKREMES